MEKWKRIRKSKKYKDIRACIISAILLIFGLAMTFAGFVVRANNSDTWIDASYVQIVERVCAEKNLCPEMVEALIEAESSGQSNVISSYGCVGLMQVSPRYSGYTAAELTNPTTNIEAGTDILLELFKKYGDMYTVLMCYNEGEYSGAIERAESGKYSQYATKIAKRTEILERLHGK